MKSVRLAVTIFTLFLVAGFQCHKGDYNINPHFAFEEKLSLTPYKKVYAIGDSIRIHFETADRSFFDKLSGARVNTDTTYLSSFIHYQKRYPISTVQEFFADVKADSVIDQTYKIQYTYYNTVEFKTPCTGNRYFFTITFVPKTTGIYSIEPFASQNPCPTKRLFELSTFRFLFDLSDCNKDIWLSIPSSSRGGETDFTDVRIDKKEIFVFKVG